MILQALKVLFVISPIRDLRRLLLRLILRFDAPRFDTASELLEKHLNIKIGRYSYGAHKVDGSIAPGTVIGRFCSIAPGVRLGGMNHPQHLVSTHPFLYFANRGFVQQDLVDYKAEGNRPVIIEDDVWIGQNAIVLPGVRIGKGAIVAAGAVVTKEVPPYSVVGGVPAREIRKRFTPEIMQQLLQIDWCSWKDEEIAQRLQDFYDVHTFVSTYGTKRESHKA